MSGGGASWFRGVACTAVKAVAWFLALDAAIAAVLTHGGRWSPWLDVLTHFAPVWLAAGTVALGLAALLWRWGPRPRLAATALVGILAAGALMAPEYLRPMTPHVPAPAGRTMKVIQFNSRGNAGDYESGDVAAAARWIADEDPDIIVLEEVYPPIRDAILALGRYQASPTVADCAACRILIFSKATPVDQGMREGWVDHWWAPMARASFADADGGFSVVAVHLGWPAPPGRQQAGADQLTKVVDQLERSRLIVAGDFNSTPWSYGLRRIDQALGIERRERAAFSWPVDRVTRLRLSAPFTFLPIDHLYAGSAWRTVKIEAGPRGLGSDHLPLIAVLALDPPPN